MRLPCRNSASEKFVKLRLMHLMGCSESLDLDLCRVLLFQRICSFQIFTTHPVVCISIFRLAGIAY